MFICFLFLLGMFSNDDFLDSPARKKHQNECIYRCTEKQAALTSGLFAFWKLHVEKMNTFL